MTKAGNTLSITLDGVRGIAATSVIFSHVFMLYYNEAHYGPAGDNASAIALSIFNSPFSFFYRGGAAVLLFFLLSGYVLCSACLKKAPHDASYVRVAAGKRYLRLGLPVAAAVCLGYIGIAAGIFPAAPDGVNPFLDFPDRDLGFMQMIRSALYSSMLFGDGNFDYVLWTISIEFYGSLLVFALYALLGTNRALLITSGVGMGSYLLFAPQPYNMYSLFFFGVVFAATKFRTFARLPRQTVVLMSGALLILGCYLIGFYDTSTSYQWLASVSHKVTRVSPAADPGVIYPALGSMCLLLSLLIGLNPGQKSSGTGSRVLGGLGKLSFSVYLLHPLILATVGKMIFLELGRNMYSMLLCLATVLVGSYVCAYFFYNHIDKPSIRLANWFGQRVFVKRPVLQGL